MRNIAHMESVTWFTKGNKAMAQVSEMTIRLDILREAKDRYESLQKMVAVTTAESFVYGLKIVECEVMGEAKPNQRTFSWRLIPPGEQSICKLFSLHLDCNKKLFRITPIEIGTKTMLLTQNEKSALTGIVESDYMSETGRDIIACPVWAWSANPFRNKKIFSGTCAALSRKGLIHCDGAGPTATLAITREGYRAMMENDISTGETVQKRIVTARSPKAIAMAKAKTPAKTPVIVKAQPKKRENVSKAQAKVSDSRNNFIVIQWRGFTIHVNIIGHTEKAWKFVAIDEHGEIGFECWLPKSTLETLPNGNFKVADWFNPNGYVAKWFQYNNR